MKTIVHFIFLMIFFTSCFTQSVSEYSFMEVYEVSSPSKLKANTNDGDIHVSSHNKQNIEVYFRVKKGNKFVMISRDELERYVDIDVLHTSNRLEIMIRQKETEKLKKWDERYYVSLEIYTPIETACSLHSSDGDISINGLQSDQRCQTSDGDIVIKDIDGSVTGNTSDGDVKADNIKGTIDFTTSDGDANITNISGLTTLKTSDGDIYIADIKGLVSAHTSDGDINAHRVLGNSEFKTSDGSIHMFEIEGMVNSRTSDGDIEFEKLTGSLTASTSDGNILGNMVTLKDKLSLHTGDGDIFVSVPKGLGLSLYLKGEDINTRFENFTGTTEEHLIRGDINGGGIMVELTSSDGNITLRYD